MKQYIKTSWYYHIFKEDHTSEKSNSDKWKNGIWTRNYWKVSRESLKEAMSGLSKYCNENNYEIKGIIPIDRAQSYEYGQADFEAKSGQGWGWGYGWGLGQGWGITMTDGFAAMLQSIEMLTDEEYDARITEDERLRKLDEKKSALEENKNKYLSLINDANTKLAQNNETIVEKEATISTGITEQEKGLLKKRSVYIFNDQVYSHQNEAEADLKQLMTEVEKLRIENNVLATNIAQNQELLNKVMQELESL